MIKSLEIMKVETKEEISENFSEKKKRGRPRVHHPEIEKRVRRERERESKL